MTDMTDDELMKHVLTSVSQRFLGRPRPEIMDEMVRMLPAGFLDEDNLIALSDNISRGVAMGE